MASIPLVALNSQVPDQPDLLQKYGQLQALRNNQQQMQLNQQEAPLRLQQLQQGVQQGAGQLQIQQQAIKDQQAQTTAMQQWDGKQIDELYPLILKNGGSAEAVMGLKSKVLTQQQAAATAFKNTADGGKAQVETLKQKGDLISGALSPLIDPNQVPDAQLPQALQATTQDLVQKGLLDPQHAQAAQQLLQQSGGDPAKIRQGLDQFTKTFMAQSQIAEQAHKEAITAQSQAETKKINASIDPTSPLYSPSPAAVAMGTAPGAAQIQAGEARLAGQKAGAEAAARQPYEMSLARQRQALSQGDPNAAAQLLVSGDATLSELKARGATPDFIANTLNAAHQLSGGKYNAQTADAQFSVAKSPANVAFFGSAKSLIDKGGTLDQLTEAGKAIPGGLIPAFNSIADWQKAATGSGPIAKYASLALGVADDYSKVMGGGQGSDSSRLQALQLVGAKQSPAQRAASIDGIRGAVGSQTTSRIGNNPVLGRMYGSELPTPAQGGQGGIQVGQQVTLKNGQKVTVKAVHPDGSFE
jgi:hypothetical protein